MGYSSFQGLFRDELAKRFVVNPCIGSGLGGLGAEEGCDQPVSTAERDTIRDRLNTFTRDYMGQRPVGIHWHENHPDIKAALGDIIPRMIGLTGRPKLLRCNAEARRRADNWCGSLQDLLRRVKSGGATVVPQTFKWGFYRGPTYTIRSSGDPAVNKAMRGEAPPPPVVSSHPPGTVVTEPAPAPGEAPALPPGGGAPNGEAPLVTLPPELEGVWESLTTGEVFGFPKEYVTYAVLGLLAYNFFLKGKRRR